MIVNDKRVKHESNVLFEELSIGQVYEDKDGLLCIKTNDTDNENNCIYFAGNTWLSDFEGTYAKVIPLVATLEIEKVKDND